jgi:hypothetical protein
VQTANLIPVLTIINLVNDFTSAAEFCFMSGSEHILSSHREALTPFPNSDLVRSCSERAGLSPGGAFDPENWI